MHYITYEIKEQYVIILSLFVGFDLMSHAAVLIGKNIKLARVKNGWSQAELAHKLNVEQSYISRVESASVAASCERIYEIIHLLKCESTDIFPAVSQVKENQKKS